MTTVSVAPERKRLTPLDVRLIAKAEISVLVANLLPSHRVGGPMLWDGIATFGEIEQPDELTLTEGPTFASAKQFVFPAEETVLRYEFNGAVSVEPVVAAPPTVVFGLHPCDLHALNFMDRAFGGGPWPSPADPNYEARRKSLVVIGLDCERLCDSQAFCRDMETLAAPEQGWDALMIDYGDAYVVEIATDAGQAVFDQATTSPAPEDARTHVREMRMGREDAFPRQLERLLHDLPALLAANQEHAVWEEMGEKCLACSSCTAVCPTCFCFDTRERLRPDVSGGERCRIWDSCQLRTFALVAGGHNFRAERGERQRHFTMHKSRFILDDYGVPGCVGCGRCGRACPVDINQIEILNRLARDA